MAGRRRESRGKGNIFTCLFLFMCMCISLIYVWVPVEAIRGRVRTPGAVVTGSCEPFGTELRSTGRAGCAIND